VCYLARETLRRFWKGLAGAQIGQCLRQVHPKAGVHSIAGGLSSEQRSPSPPLGSPTSGMVIDKWLHLSRPQMVHL
jgi:hypothetical protein